MWLPPQYQRDGFLVFLGLFAAREIEAMTRELQRVAGIDTDRLVRERTGRHRQDDLSRA